MVKLPPSLPEYKGDFHSEIEGRIPYIDGLRAVAILSVLAYHFELGLFLNGFLGVDIFFVISGYVVCRSLASVARDGDGFVAYLEHFYRRRFWRLIPALAAMVAATLVVAVLFVPPAYMSRHLFFTAAGAMTGSANIILALASGTNYFDQMTGYNPFLHTWSLGVEEQFYVILPILVWLAFRRSSLSLLLPILAVASLGAAAYWSLEHQSYAFYLLPSRFWELAAGALAFCHEKRARAWVTGLPAVLAGWSGLGMVLLALALPVPLASPLPGAILPTFGMVLLIWYAAPSTGRLAAGSAAWWLSARAMVYVGKISYSLYLWHWPVLVLMRWTIGYVDAAHIILACLLSAVLGVLSYHLIELPFQNVRHARAPMKPVQFLVIGGFILMLPVGVIFAGHERDYTLSRPLGQLSVVQQEFGWLPTELPSSGRQEMPAFGPDEPSMIVIGDSHAGHISGAAIAVAKDAGLGLRIYSGCSYTLLAPVTNANCAATLDQAKAGDVIVFSSLNLPRYVNQDGEKLPEPPDGPTESDARRLAVAQFTDLARSLRERGVAVIYRGPEPLFHYIAYRCSDWFNRINPICAVAPSEPRIALLTRAQPNLDGIAQVARDVPDLVVWEVFDTLCPGDPCKVHDEKGHPLFFDQDHLTGWGAELLVNSLKEVTELALSTARTSTE